MSTSPSGASGMRMNGPRSNVVPLRWRIGRPSVDLAVVGCVPFSPALATLPDDVGHVGGIVGQIVALADHPTPWVAVVDAGSRYDPMVDRIGIPVIRSMDRAVRLLGDYARNRLDR